MGIDYTSGIFFGTFAKDGTPAHRQLRKLYEEEEDEVSIEAVRTAFICRHGNSIAGAYRFAVRVGDGHSFSSRGSGQRGPFTIDPGSSADVVAAIKALDLSPEDFEGVGFWVYQDVW